MIDAISLQLGEFSSDIESIELISSDDRSTTRCPLKRHFKRVPSASTTSVRSKSTTYAFRCSATNVSSVRIRAVSRLHLCHVSVLSTKASKLLYSHSRKLSISILVYIFLF